MPLAAVDTHTLPLRVNVNQRLPSPLRPASQLRPQAEDSVLRSQEHEHRRSIIRQPVEIGVRLPGRQISPELRFDEHTFRAVLIDSDQIGAGPVQRTGLRSHPVDRLHVPDAGPNHVVQPFPGTRVLVQNVAESLDGDVLGLRRKRRRQMS